MNWLIFAIACWVTFALEWGFRQALELGATGIAPTFPIVLLVFVALRAPTMTTMSAAVAVGALYDLAHVVPVQGGLETVVLGPHVLGCMLGAHAILLGRGLMYRRGLLAVVATAALTAALMSIVVTVLHGVRSTYDVVEPVRAIVQLGRGLGSALCTGVAAGVLGSILLAIRGAFQFPAASGPTYRS